MIAELLRTGKDNAVTLDQLAEATGLSRRATMHRIAQERFEGAEIIGSNKGFCLPADNKERLEYIARLEHGIKARAATAKAIRRKLKGIEGQADIFRDMARDTFDSGIQEEQGSTAQDLYGVHRTENERL